MRNNITKYFNLILIVAGFLIVSCDDRVPTETTDSDMNLTLTTQPVAIDLSGNLINVGEDVSGILAYTLVTASVLSDSNEAVENVEVNFSATLNGETFGSFDSPISLTNDDGYALAVLDDGNSSGSNIKITTDINGVISKTVSIEIIDTTLIQVWPYRLYVSVDSSQIFIDNGVTNSNISARILNYNYQPIENLEVSFELQPDGLGILTASSVNTDTTGTAQIQLIDTGNAEDIGQVTIFSSYEHPSFGSLQDSVMISILPSINLNLLLSTQPVAYDSNNNFINVGEDVLGNSAYTLVTALVLSNNNEGIENLEVQFSATLNGETFGSFDSPISLTNDDGYALAVLDDGNSSGSNIKITTDINGVISKTVSIEIIDATLIQVWPYRMYSSVDNSQIFVDNGLTYSNVTARIYDPNYQPIENLEVSFELQPDDIGILTSSSASTDTTGTASVQLIDTGNPADIGLVSIISSFEHPSFGHVKDTVAVFISSPSNLNLTLTTLPIGIDQQTVVGEDVVGEYAYTLVTALLKDQDGNPVAGKVISFNSRVNNQSSGSFNVSSGTTNSQGMVVVYFIDSGSAVDVSGTPAYEGVIVTGYYSNDVTASDGFNVYESRNDVWPYNLILFSDTDVINLDGGQTTATVTARLLNNQNDPAKFVEIAFDATKGFIDATGITDSTGLVDVTFSDFGNPEDVGVANIDASFVHPAFGEITNNIQITIVDTAYSGTPAYLEIPSSYPDEIMVAGGGGLESTQICARVFDESGVLVDEPVSVTFTLGPNIPIGANINNIGPIDSSYTADGEACISLNSGTGPGPVRVTAAVTTESGEIISATEVPVIIATGPPYYIEPNYDPGATIPIGGGAYQTEAAAMVYDLWYNPVADSTYVYWSIDPVPPDTVIDAFVEGVSFTHNENLNGDSYSGMAFTTIIYSTDAIAHFGYVTALTFGTNGDTVMARINENEGETNMTFVPGTLVLSAASTYVDFTALGASSTTINITGTLQDFYGNPVAEAPIVLNAPGASNIYWPSSPFVNNVGRTDENGQVTWVVEYNIGVCAWIVGTDDPAQYEDFTSSITATLLIAQSITSDPIDILLVRTPIGP